MIKENYQTNEIISRYRIADVIAIFCSVLFIEQIILFLNFERIIDWNKLLLDLSLGLISYFSIYFLLNQKKTILRIPSIVWIVFGGTVLWLVVKSIKFIYAGKDLVIKDGFSYLNEQIIVSAKMSLIVIPFIVLITLSIVAFFRILVFIFNLIKK